MDRSWVRLNRLTDAYKAGLDEFLDMAVRHTGVNGHILCPCKQCCNRYRFLRQVVSNHIIVNDMERRYKTASWAPHGDAPMANVISETSIGNQSEGNDMHVLLREIFGDQSDVEQDGSHSHHAVHPEGRTPDADRFYKLVSEANKELYPGCKKFKKLEFIVKLYQLKAISGWSDKSFSSLLDIMRDALPEGETLPKSFYQTKKLIGELGLSYEKIDACRNDCMLYWRETERATSCIKCGVSRWKDPEKKVSAKVFRYFPLTPRLQRLYMSSHTAKHMKWHDSDRKKDGVMRHPADSPHWKNLDDRYPDFAEESRNVRLGLASDGFNPFGNMSTAHSTWPVVLAVYNLPPWMCMKKPYLIMSSLISGPRGPGNDIDVYLQPLIHELKELWDTGGGRQREGMHVHIATMKHAQNGCPLAMRQVLPTTVMAALNGLSVFFKALCVQNATPEDFNQLSCKIALALCDMEKIFPPAFFDIMVHLPVHLAYEAAIAGPVPYRWMYPIERYLHDLKGYVRNKSRPEGCIAEGYLVEECLSFCSMYLEDIDTRRSRLGRNTDQCDRLVADGLSVFVSNGRPLGKEECIQLEGNVWNRARHYVLCNCPEVKPFIDEHLQLLRLTHPRKTLLELERMQKDKFAFWFHDRVDNMYRSDPALVTEDLHFLAIGPEKWARRYKKYVVNGFRFRTKAMDATGPSQNSGVFVTACTSSYSSARDRNPTQGVVDYYGVLTDVIVLSYHGGRKVVLFECDWVDVLSTGRGIKIDEFGFTLVNLNRTISTDDKFIIASQAMQVFYVQDPIQVEWHVAVKTRPRDLFDMN